MTAPLSILDAAVPGCADCRHHAVNVNDSAVGFRRAARSRANAMVPVRIKSADTILTRARARRDSALARFAEHLAAEHGNAMGDAA